MSDPVLDLHVEMRQHRELARAYERARRAQLRLPMEDMSRKAAASVRKNFDSGGRPTLWQALKNRDGKPLLKTRTLRGSIRRRILWGKGYQIYSVDIPGKVQTHEYGSERTITPVNAPYLAWQVKGRWHRKLPAGSSTHVTIPARPFMFLQASDVEWAVDRLGRAVAQHLKKHRVA